MASAAGRHTIERPTTVTGAFTGLVLQGTYALGRRIGCGGIGEVYEAAHVRLPGRMAVKFIKPVLVGDTLTLYGCVRGMQPEDGRVRVEVEVWCENQDGVKTMVGEASGLAAGAA